MSAPAEGRDAARPEGFYWVREVGPGGRMYAWQIGEWIPEGIGEVSQAHWLTAGIEYTDGSFECGPRILPPDVHDDLVAALKDALAGLRYIREHYHDERTATGSAAG